METTESLLDALKTRLSLRSDYALAKYLGVTTVSMARWRAGGSLSDENAIRVADLLKMPRAYVLACMAAQRSESDSESSGVWRQIAESFRDKVALLALCATLGITGYAGFPTPAEAVPVGFDNCILSKIGNRRRRAAA